MTFEECINIINNKLIAAIIIIYSSFNLYIIQKCIIQIT